MWGVGFGGGYGCRSESGSRDQSTSIRATCLHVGFLITTRFYMLSCYLLPEIYGELLSTTIHLVNIYTLNYY